MAAFAMVVGALPASADHKDFPSTKNMHALGESIHRASFDVPVAEREISSDLAFWGKLAFQGNWFGFNLRDISAPGNPKPISFTDCTGGQGDVVVWENILVRSWDSGAAPGSGAHPGATCGGEDVPLDWTIDPPEADCSLIRSVSPHRIYLATPVDDSETGWADPTRLFHLDPETGTLGSAGGRSTLAWFPWGETGVTSSGP